MTVHLVYTPVTSTKSNRQVHFAQITMHIRGDPGFDKMGGAGGGAMKSSSLCTPPSNKTSTNNFSLGLLPPQRPPPPSPPHGTLEFS